MELGTILQLTAYVAYWAAVFVFALDILKQRRDPARSLSWIAAVILLPFAGMVMYLFFGRNFRRKWIQHRREIRNLEYLETYCRRQLDKVSRIFPDHDLGRHRQFITLLLNNSRSLLTTNNSVTILHNGRETIDAIMESIRNAKKSVDLEYYVFEPDRVGNALLDLLVEKAHSGVRVRLLYDDVGSWKFKKSMVKRLRAEGLGISCFFPVVFPFFSSRLNNRNHRKIVVVDGKIGFTGGINIAERYLADSWHDTHLRIEGDAVRMLQLTFMADWHYATKETTQDWQSYMKPETEKLGYLPMQIAVSGPDSEWASIMQAYFEAITKARKSIFISTPYFTPTQPILTALKVAALGGIDVRIMLPEKTDVRMAHWATRSFFTELLDANVGIYLYTKGFVHRKMLCVDDDICSVGSVNMDERSFEDNYEVTAFIYDRSTIDVMKGMFLEECASCRILTSEEWESRKNRNDLTEAICRLISPLL